MEKKKLIKKNFFLLAHSILIYCYHVELQRKHPALVHLIIFSKFFLKSKALIGEKYICFDYNFTWPIALFKYQLQSNAKKYSQ